MPKKITRENNFQFRILCSTSTIQRQEYGEGKMKHARFHNYDQSVKWQKSFQKFDNKCLKLSKKKDKSMRKTISDLQDIKTFIRGYWKTCFTKIRTHTEKEKEMGSQKQGIQDKKTAKRCLRQ